MLTFSKVTTGNSLTAITLFNLKPLEDENEVKVEAPVEKSSTTTTTTTTATTTTRDTPTLRPLGVTLRTAVTRSTTRPTTRRTTTRAPTTEATTKAPEPGILGRIGNLINNGLGNVLNAGLGSNVISTGSLLAAAASPLWAPFLVGKKRRKRSEYDSLNEIQQANMQHYTKLIMSDIQKTKNNYH